MRNGSKKIEKIKKITEIRNTGLNALVSETNRKPQCYTDNPALRELLHGISANFNRSLCEGYLFGSANYKVLPNDFDIVLPNIKSNRDKANVAELITLFEQQGGTTGPEYFKTNRHVIPVSWKGWKIDFILFEQSYPIHASMLDFTVGAMYFDLRQLKMFRINALQSFFDWDKKKINTISNAYLSFTTDPSRIFRAVRLVVTEGFYFSQAALDAINAAFLGNGNLFRTMPKGKLDQQLSLLCSSGCDVIKNERKNIEVLHYQLGIFFKLYDVLAERHDVNAQQFLNQFVVYRNEFIQANAALQHQSRALYHSKHGFFPLPPVESQPNSMRRDATQNGTWYA